MHRRWQFEHELISSLDCIQTVPTTGYKQFVYVYFLSVKKITFAPLEKRKGIHEKYPEFLHYSSY